MRKILYQKHQLDFIPKTSTQTPTRYTRINTVYENITSDVILSAEHCKVIFSGQENPRQYRQVSINTFSTQIAIIKLDQTI